MIRSCLILLLLSASLSAEEWNEFRGPTGQGHSAVTGLPTTWSETENVRWKASLPGYGWSSPIIANGRIYLTTAVENDKGQSLRALSVDPANGKVLWDVELFQQNADDPRSKIHKKNSHASPTPLFDGENIYVHFGTFGTACLTLDGQVVWKNDTLVYRPQHGNGGSPALVGDSLVIICDGSDKNFAIALDKKTGDEIWKTSREPIQRKHFSFGTPLLINVKGQLQLICPGTDFVYAYNPQNGKEIWRVQYDGYSLIPRPVYGQGLVFICTGYNTPSLLAIDPNGKGDITKTNVVWEVNRAVPHSASVLLVGDGLYMMSDRGIASCLDAKTGDVRWQERVGGNYSASPIYADGKIYFQSETGETTVIRPGAEYDEVAKNVIGETGADRPATLASFAIIDHAILLRTKDHLYRIEK